MKESIQQVELTIEGRVQGVGFRYFTIRQAKELKKITGWVKNEADGTVKVVAEGPRVKLNKLIKKLAVGPRSARVDNITQNWSEPTNSFKSFKVRY